MVTRCDRAAEWAPLALRQAKEKRRKDAMDPPTEAELEEDRLRSKAATIAHDAKVRAYVEQIKRENAKRWPNGRPLPEGATASTEPVPIAYDAAAQAGGSPADMQAAEAAAAEEEERERAETFTVNQPTAAEVAAKATSWLASQGITAPPAKSDGGAGTAAADAAAGTAADAAADAAAGTAAAGAAAADAAAGAAAADAAANAAVVQPASASGIEEVMGYRVYLGSEQWQVRWADDGGTSWERLDVLDTESLRDRAAQLRAASTGGSS